MSPINQIDRLKSQLYALRPLPEAVDKNINKDILLRWTYYSNAIEGNTLTLLETKVVLEGITVGGKSMGEHLEAINHRDAIYFLEDLVKENNPLSECDILQIHSLILKGIHDDYAGR